MKKLPIKSKNKGFTLVEVIIALAIFAILSLMVAMLLHASMNLQSSNLALDEDIEIQGIKLMQKVESEVYDESTAQEFKIIFKSDESGVPDGEINTDVNIKASADEGDDVNFSYIIDDASNTTPGDGDDGGDAPGVINKKTRISGGRGIYAVEGEAPSLAVTGSIKVNIQSAGVGKYNITATIVDKNVDNKTRRQIKIHFKESVKKFTATSAMPSTAVAELINGDDVRLSWQGVNGGSTSEFKFTIETDEVLPVNGVGNDGNNNAYFSLRTPKIAEYQPDFTDGIYAEDPVT